MLVGPGEQAVVDLVVVVDTSRLLYFTSHTRPLENKEIFPVSVLITGIGSYWYRYRKLLVNSRKLLVYEFI